MVQWINILFTDLSSEYLLSTFHVSGAIQGIGDLPVTPTTMPPVIMELIMDQSCPIREIAPP